MNIDFLGMAIEIATLAHGGKYDLAEKPYILHPLRVMFQFSDPEEMIVAVLHDVIEDSEWTVDGLRRMCFSQTVTDALECLTHVKDENYTDYIQRVSTNTLAIKVKCADLKDNMDMSRLPIIRPSDIERLKKYRIALEFLEQKRSNLQVFPPSSDK